MKPWLLLVKLFLLYIGSTASAVAANLPLQEQLNSSYSQPSKHALKESFSVFSSIEKAIKKRIKPYTFLTLFIDSNKKVSLLTANDYLTLNPLSHSNQLLLVEINQQRLFSTHLRQYSRYVKQLHFFTPHYYNQNDIHAFINT